MVNKIFLFLVLLFAIPSVSACDGRFETRWQNVLVCGAHYQRVWISEPYTPVGGYWSEVYVPARYERRLVQVWIPERKGGGSFNLGITWNWHTW